MEDFVVCQLCKDRLLSITLSHLKKHNINFEDYNSHFPNSSKTSQITIERRKKSMLGHPTSEETKKKISDKHKGKKLSEEHKRKISELQKGKKLTKEHRNNIRKYLQIHGGTFKGRKHTEEAKRIIGLKGIGRVPWNKNKQWSKEIRDRIGLKLRGRHLSLETRKKMSISRRGLKHSIETKQKLSRLKKGLKRSPEHTRKLMESIKRSPNKFEEKCIQLFKEHQLPLKFVGGFYLKEFFIGGRVPDFVATNGKKIVVEVFYEYFKIKAYGSVENYKKVRATHFLKFGWKTLFFTYSDIHQRFEECLKTLKKELD